MRRAFAGILLSGVVITTAACGPQVVDCEEQICVNTDERRDFSGDREYDDEEWDD